MSISRRLQQVGVSKTKKCYILQWGIAPKTNDDPIIGIKVSRICKINLLNVLTFI